MEPTRGWDETPRGSFTNVRRTFEDGTPLPATFDMEHAV